MKKLKKLSQFLLLIFSTFLISVVSIPHLINFQFGTQSVHAEEKSYELKNNSIFRIQPTKAQHLVLDAFGDSLPSWKTKVHLYSKAGSVTTSEIIAYLQPENNNSYELHMQNDRNLCIGPDVTSFKNVKNGTPMVVKRDCANTLNHIQEGEQLRVNNTNYCVDIPYADFNMYKSVQYHTCNLTSAQRMELVESKSDDKYVTGNCYRSKNGLFGVPYIKGCSDKQIPQGFKEIEWTGGAYANLIFKTAIPFSSSDKIEYGSGGFSYTLSVDSGLPTKYNYHIHNQTGKIEIPADAKTYTIEPWNENSTTRYQFIRPSFK